MANVQGGASEGTGGAAGAPKDLPVDLEVLARLMGNPGPDALNRMLAVFWQTENETRRVLRGLTDARDGKALAEAAHGAKGAASCVGATRLADLCKRLELAAKGDDWNVVAAVMAQVEQAYSDLGGFIGENAAMIAP